MTPTRWPERLGVRLPAERIDRMRCPHDSRAVSISTIERNVMSHKATAWAWTVRGLKPATKIVLLHLADRHNPDLGCFPSIKRLAADCEMSVRSVQNHLQALEDAGHVSRKHRFRDDGSATSSEYILHGVVQNLQGGGAKSAGGVVQNLPTINPVSINPVTLTNTFDAAWSAYPRKIGKAAARKAWEKATEKVSPDVLSDKLAEYVDSLAGTDPRYTPHLSTWLNGERWQDEIEKPQKSGFRSMVAELAMGGE